jgi:hypothetical protein
VVIVRNSTDQLPTRGYAFDVNSPPNSHLNKKGMLVTLEQVLDNLHAMALKTAPAKLPAKPKK